MSHNLSLWDIVEKTDPSHTKQVNFGRKITAIDPYRQIKSATQQFGPAGVGWGWEVKQVQHLPTNEICVLISLWHGEEMYKFSGRVEQWGQASLYIDKAEQKKDTDCMKKATTDGITKCLSLLGFNADIFLGKYDDNKYVQQLQKEFTAPAFTEQQKEQMNTHILEGDSLALACFLSLLDEEIQGALFNSFEKGAKSSGKQTIRDMFEEGKKIMDTLELDILSMLEAEDGQGLLEATSELNGAEKRCLVARIGDRKTQDLSNLVRTAKEAQ